MDASRYHADATCKIHSGAGGGTTASRWLCLLTSGVSRVDAAAPAPLFIAASRTAPLPPHAGAMMAAAYCSSTAATPFPASTRRYYLMPIWHHRRMAHIPGQFPDRDFAACRCRALMRIGYLSCAHSAKFLSALHISIFEFRRSAPFLGLGQCRWRCARDALRILSLSVTPKRHGISAISGDAAPIAIGIAMLTSFGSNAAAR